jgi:hypothetical protein
MLKDHIGQAISRLMLSIAMGRALWFSLMQLVT